MKLPHLSRTRIVLTGLLFSIVAAAFGWQTIGRTARPAPLAGMLPQGALLTIESPDFAALLNAWNASPEQAAWLKSANYSVFSNSRLFGRLSDAQTQFENAAGLPADASLLKQVAGKQSIFAWYDIGNLEFLYLTRMPAGQSAQTALLQGRAKWSRRESAGVAFYIRKTPAGAEGPSRTVAFATSGDWLLLATREDLMAQALRLLGGSSQESVAAEPWYKDAQAADAQAANPDLHMVLNLDRLVPTPYFRSYWVQRNITEMGSYRAAVADLYRESGRFREERVLMPKDNLPAQASGVNLGQLAALAPAGTGVYRATSTQDAAVAYATLEEKLLDRGGSIGAAPVGSDAPEPDVEVSPTGSASDFETRIDAVAAVSASQPKPRPALRQLLDGAGLEASLTLDSAGAEAGLWIPIRSAVVLQAAKPWDEAALEAAVQQDLRGRLTAGTLGLEWLPRTVEGHAFHVLGGAHPLALAVEGNLCLLANDPALMASLLARLHASPLDAPNASLIAGFDHASQRGPYLRLAGLLDGGGNASEGAAPAFFPGTVGSLSQSFATLASEQIVERPDGANLHQTVTYQWQK
ncbi:hypothetical protein SAMN05421770_105204 [Granulicella rosea]|uniref:DUF3352 domain-containing protein n=1 Tax=Granulicella rosea TaxID=474952 RepID=A0A239KUU1_9BACT|nr:hypothetical protein [Granulicella rosea]SNT21522.1 hypothetical protein SAMN05421770_105204 [Granulicella rosea]